MAFLRCSASEREETEKSAMLSDRENIDAYACPTLELSRAVSVSLGLDPLSSPLGGINLCPGSAFADPAGNGSSEGAEGGRLIRDGGSLGVDEFGEVCHGLRQVSCADQFGDMESAQSVTRGSVISRFVCKDSNMMMSSMSEVPTNPQVAPAGPLKPYSAYPADADLYRETQGGWCATERAYGEQPQPHRGAYDGPAFLCKYCGQTSFGPRQECSCVWYRRVDRASKAAAQVSAAQAFGQVESYPEVIPQGQNTFSTIKAEPSVWLHCTDRGFRHEDFFPGVFLSDRRVCQVCGDDASGCHYGAVTCGSCKVFFKRAAAGKQNHLCASRNDCTIDKLRRKNCASCRLKRCFMSGMSLKGRRLKGAGQTRGGEEEHQPPAWGHGEREGKHNFVLEPGSAAARAQGPQLLGIPPTMRSCFSLLTILQSIEPTVVNAGHDPAQPDSSASLLTSLNELGERQLVTVVRWAKAIPALLGQTCAAPQTVQHICMTQQTAMIWRCFKSGLPYLVHCLDRSKCISNTNCSRQLTTQWKSGSVSAYLKMSYY
uniref:Androgen receptor n=2 Tax=Cyprinodon variegatus TaxID=28743 RepID=A0A3Q2CEE4_CYPVA